MERIKKLTKLLTERHREILQHSIHLGDKLQIIYTDLRVVNKSLIAKDYIGAEELLTEILEGE